MKILSHNGAGHSTRSFFYSFGAQEINNARGMHSDRHRSCYSLRFYQFIPYVASFGWPFALCTESPLLILSQLSVRVRRRHRSCLSIVLVENLV